MEREIDNNMRLRDLRSKDAPLMLEWMHDPSVVKDLKANFAAKTIEDCERFIEASLHQEENKNLAIVDDDDIYMGTVSLKHITADNAEFAITVRKAAMGKGYSRYAMHEIIRIGLEDMGLEYVYWCVSPVNERAVHFYDKNGYTRVSIEQDKLMGTVQALGTYSEAQIRDYLWYIAR